MPRNRAQIGSKPLIEGALLAAITVVLALLAFYVPPAGAGLSLLWPVPIALVHLRHGLRVSILTVIVAGLTLTTFVGPLEAIGMVSTFGFMGLALGWCFQRKVSPFHTVLVGGVAMLGSMLISLALSFVFLKVTPGQMLNEMSHAMQQADQLWQRFGVPESQVREVRQVWETSLRLLRFVFPGVIVMGSLMNSFLNFQVARGILNRMGYKIEDVPPFETWRVPGYTLLGLAAGYLFGIINGPWRVGRGMGQLRRIESIGDPLLDIGAWRWVFMAGANVQVVFVMLFTVYGMAVAYWFMKNRWRLSKPMSVFLLIMAMFNPLLGQIVMFLGVLDCAFDWRKLGFGR
ncbi:MAG: YybS family protein [Bacillota bacterium]